MNAKQPVEKLTIKQPEVRVAIEHAGALLRFLPPYYPILHGMERQGYLRSRLTLNGGRNRRVYRERAGAQAITVPTELVDHRLAEDRTFRSVMEQMKPRISPA